MKMNQVTQLALKNIHPKWMTLLRTPVKHGNGELLIDVLDRTITAIVNLKVKLCPDNPDKILRCLQLDPDLIKVVIVGQDVYPRPGVTTGLAFAIKPGEEIQPSLSMLIREMDAEFPDQLEPFDTSLESWEKQGVLLLNSALSCEQFKPGSHIYLWQEFIEGLMVILNDFKITRQQMTSIVFVFLGKQAQLFQNEINDAWHFKINRFHPVAESYGSNKFNGFFNEVNIRLQESGQNHINWTNAAPKQN